MRAAWWTESNAGRSMAIRGVRAVVVLAALLTASEAAAWVAILVHAYDVGGPGVAGIAVAVQLVPSGLAAPIGGILADRWGRGRTLVGAVAVLPLVGIAAWVALGSGLGLWAVLAAGALLSVGFAMARPLLSAVLPGLVPGPSELMTANGLVGVASSAAYVVGPLVAAGLLVRGPTAVFVLVSALLVVAAWMARPVRSVGRDGLRPRGSVTGLAELVRLGEVRPLLLLGSVHQFVVGAVDVLIVALAVGVLAAGDPAAAVLMAAQGLGGVVGGVLTFRLAGRRRLTGSLLAAAATFGLPIALLGLLPGLALGVVTLVVVGIGDVALDVLGRTAIQRVAPPHLMSRTFGAFESFREWSIGLGSLAAGLLVAAVGLEAAAAVVGLLVPVAAAIGIGALRRVDEGGDIPWERVTTVAAIPLFESLSVRQQEALAERSEEVEVTAGAVLIEEGAEGDRFFAVLEGGVVVTKGGREVARLGPGDHFGEIALVRGIRRTASVSASGPTRLLAIDRAAFLDAVLANPLVAADVGDEAGRRLDELGTP